MLQPFGSEVSSQPAHSIERISMKEQQSYNIQVLYRTAMRSSYKPVFVASDSAVIKALNGAEGAKYDFLRTRYKRKDQP
jgi:hypothetical protein